MDGRRILRGEDAEHRASGKQAGCGNGDQCQPGRLGDGAVGDLVEVHVTVHRQPKLKVSKESVKRFKDKLRQTFQMGRGRYLRTQLGDSSGVLGGWVSHYRLAEVEASTDPLRGALPTRQ